MANIKVYDPNGQLGEIPEEQLETAVAQGYSIEAPMASQNPISEETPISSTLITKEGTDEVYVVNDDGEFGSIPKANLESSGYRPALPEEVEEAKYNTTGEQLKTVAEGALEGATAGIGNALLEETGIIDTEAAKKREEYNPNLKIGGEVVGGVGSLMTGAGVPALITKGVAKVAGKELLETATKKTFKSVLARGGIEAAEGGIYEGIKAISENIARDPELSAEAVISAAAKGALFGGAGGALFKTAGIGLTSMGKLGKNLAGIKNQDLTLGSKLDDMSDEAMARIMGFRAKDFEKTNEATLREVADLGRKALLNSYNEADELVKKSWWDSLNTSADEIESFLSKELKKSGQTIGNFETKFNEFIENPEISPSKVEETRKIANEMLDNEQYSDIAGDVRYYNQSGNSYGYIKDAKSYIDELDKIVSNRKSSFDQILNTYNKWRNEIFELKNKLDDPNITPRDKIIAENKLKRLDEYSLAAEMELGQEYNFIKDALEKFPKHFSKKGLDLETFNKQMELTKILDNADPIQGANNLKNTLKDEYSNWVFSSGFNRPFKILNENNIEKAFADPFKKYNDQLNLATKLLENAQDFKKFPDTYNYMPSKAAEDIRYIVDTLSKGEELGNVKWTYFDAEDIPKLVEAYKKSSDVSPIKITAEDIYKKFDEIEKSLTTFGETEQMVNGKMVKVKNKPVAGNDTVVNKLRATKEQLKATGFPVSGKLSLQDLLNAKRFLDPAINWADPVERAFDKALYRVRQYAQEEALKGIDEAAKNPKFKEMVGISPEEYRKALKEYGAAKTATRTLNKEMAREMAKKPITGVDSIGLGLAFSFDPSYLAALGIKKGIQKYQDQLMAIHLTQRPGAAGGMLQAQASQEKVFNTISKSIGNFVKGAKNSVKDSTPYSMNAIMNFKDGKKEKDRVNDFKNTKKFIEDLQTNPEQLQKNLESSFKDLNDINPELYTQAVIKTTNALGFLSSKLPIDPLAARKINPTLSKWKPSDLELRKFERYLAAVDNPMSVLEDMNRGIITPEGVESLKVVYPRIYQEIYGQLMEQISTLQEELPYKQRLQLSIMFGTPTDPSLNPGTIARLQANFAPQQEQNMRKPSGAGSKSTNLQSTSEQIIKDNV